MGYAIVVVVVVIMKLLKPITGFCISVHKFVIIIVCIVDHNTLHFW